MAEPCGEGIIGVEAHGAVWGHVAGCLGDVVLAGTLLR